MAVVSKHISANLRLLGEDKRAIGTLQRIRPNFDSQAFGMIKDGVDIIRTESVAGGVLTVSSELSS